MSSAAKGERPKEWKHHHHRQHLSICASSYLIDTSIHAPHVTTTKTSQELFTVQVYLVHWDKTRMHNNNK